VSERTLIQIEDLLVVVGIFDYEEGGLGVDVEGYGDQGRHFERLI